MLFQRVNRTDPEKVFLVMKAVEAISIHQPVAMRATTDGTIGNACAIVDNAIDVYATVGLAHTAIGSGDFGLIQCYGWRDNVPVILTNTAYAILSNPSLYPDGAGQLKASVNPSAAIAALPNFVGMHSVTLATSTGTQAMGVFIRCM